MKEIMVDYSNVNISFIMFLDKYDFKRGCENSLFFYVQFTILSYDFT